MCSNIWNTFKYWGCNFWFTVFTFSCKYQTNSEQVGRIIRFLKCYKTISYYRNKQDIIIRIIITWSSLWDFQKSKKKNKTTRIANSSSFLSFMNFLSKLFGNGEGIGEVEVFILKITSLLFEKTNIHILIMKL